MASVGSRSASASRTIASASSKAPSPGERAGRGRSATAPASRRRRRSRAPGCDRRAPPPSSSASRSTSVWASSPATVERRYFSPTRVERVVRPAELPLGRVEVAGEHLHPPRLEVDARRLDLESELLEQRSAARDEVPRVVERALHRIEAAEDREQDPLRLPVAGRLLEHDSQRAIASSTWVGPSRAAPAYAVDGAALLADVARAVRVLDGALRASAASPKRQAVPADQARSRHAIASPASSPSASKTSIASAIAPSTASRCHPSASPVRSRTSSRTRRCPCSRGRSDRSPGDRLLEGLAGLVEAARHEQRLAVLGKQPNPLRVVLRQECRGAAEQRDGRGEVAAGERAPAGRREPPRAVLADRASVLVERAELGEVRSRPARGGSRGSPRTRRRDRG